MRNNRLVTSVLFIILVLILAACGSGDESTGESNTADSSNNEEQEMEREMLELEFEVMSIDVENSALQASFETNLPDETAIYRLVLTDDEGRDSFVKYEAVIGEENEVAFALKGADKDTLMDKKYQLSLELNVTERTNSNLFTDENFGGSFAEMDEAYQDADNVVVGDIGADDAYTISLISSNAEQITEDYFVE